MTGWPDGAVELSLCKSCYCMTWTMDEGSFGETTCGKCEEPKPVEPLR